MRSQAKQKEQRERVAILNYQGEDTSKSLLPCLLALMPISSLLDLDIKLGTDSRMHIIAVFALCLDEICIGGNLIAPIKCLIDLLCEALAGRQSSVTRIDGLLSSRLLWLICKLLFDCSKFFFHLTLLVRSFDLLCWGFGLGIVCVHGWSNHVWVVGFLDHCHYLLLF